VFVLGLFLIGGSINMARDKRYFGVAAILLGAIFELGFWLLINHGADLWDKR